MSRIIITGGTGLIGTALAKKYLKEGAEVIILTRRPDTANVPTGAKAVGWDAKTAQGWGQYADGAEAIVNLAGASISGSDLMGVMKGLWTDSRKKIIIDSRVNAGKAVTQAIQQATIKPKTLIQASAVGYYGNTGDKIITESDPPADDFMANVVKVWEASTDDVSEMGVRRVTIRTGVVFSTKDGALPLMLMPFKFMVGGPVGSGEQYIPWIHIDDTATAIKYLIDNDNLSGAVNVTAPNPITNKEFAKIAGNVLNRPSFMPAPAFAMRLLLGEMADILLHGQRVIPKQLQTDGFTFAFADAKNALQDLQTRKA